MSNYKDLKLVNCITPNIASNTNFSKKFRVDVEEIVKQKHIIPMQYEVISIGGNPEDLHQLSKKVDRYLLHIVEEIAEFLEEVNNIKAKILPLSEENHKECLMELIDVIGYISSILSIFYIDLYGLDKVKNAESLISSDIIFMKDNDFSTDLIKLSAFFTLSNPYKSM